jgi:hypothetical protein
MSERGAYRSIPCALFSGPDFRQLPERARWLFIVLKMNIGTVGIDVWYPDELVSRLSSESGATTEEVRATLDILEQFGWIRRADNVLWVVGHLEHDPHLSVFDAKHRKNVQRHIAGLPRVDLVRAFVGASEGWFPPEEGASMGLAWAFEGPSKGHRSKKLNKTKRNKNDIAPDGAAAGDGMKAGAPPDPPASPDQPPGADELPKTSSSWVAILGDDYEELTGGLPNYPKLGKHLKPAIDVYGLDRVRVAWRKYCESEARKYGPAYFVEHFGDYEPQIIGANGNEAEILAWMQEDRS